VPLAIPYAVDPPSWGAGRRPARHVKTALTARTDAGGSGGGLLGSPESTAGGMAPTATTRVPQAADGPPAIPEPERPRRRRSNRHPSTTRQPPTDPACAPPRRAVLAVWPDRLPDQHPTGKRPVVIRRPTGLPALRASRRACCVTGVKRQRSDGRAPWRRRVRPVQGRLDRRTESPPTPGRQSVSSVGRPAGSRRVDVSVTGATLALVEHTSAAFPPDH
jgi:hypothetical protein